MQNAMCLAAVRERIRFALLLLLYLVFKQMEAMTWQKQQQKQWR